MDLKPNLEDNQNFSKLLQNAKNFNISWSGNVKTSEVQDAISDLVEIGTSAKNENIKQAALKLYRKLYQEEIAIRTPFTKTPYMILFSRVIYAGSKDVVKRT